MHFKIVLFLFCITFLKSCSQEDAELNTPPSYSHHFVNEIDCYSFNATFTTARRMLGTQAIIKGGLVAYCENYCLSGRCFLSEDKQTIINFNLTPTRMPQTISDTLFEPVPYLSDSLDMLNYPAFLHEEKPFKYEWINIQNSYAQIRYSAFIDKNSGKHSLHALVIIYFESIGDLFFRIYIIGDHSEKAVADARDIITSLQMSFDPKDMRITCLN